MNNKVFGKFLAGNTIFALVAYLILSTLLVFVMKFVYTLIFAKIGFSLFILDGLVWLVIVMFLFNLANKIVFMFKVENARVFSLLTMITALWLVYVYYYASIAGNIASYGVFLSPFDFDAVFDILSYVFSEGISVSRRFTDAFPLPSVLNYIFAFIVTVSFLIPKGSFSFSKGVYIDGNKVEFEKYYLFSTKKIDNLTLKSEEEILKLSESDLATKFPLAGKYYTLYVSKDHANRVYQLVQNTITGSKSSKGIKVNDDEKYYYNITFDINSFVNSLAPFQKRSDEVLNKLKEELGKSKDDQKYEDMLFKKK